MRKIMRGAYTEHENCSKQNSRNNYGVVFFFFFFISKRSFLDSRLIRDTCSISTNVAIVRKGDVRSSKLREIFARAAIGSRKSWHVFK